MQHSSTMLEVLEMTEGMGIPTSRLIPCSGAAGTSKYLSYQIPVLCGMTSLVNSLGGFDKEKESLMPLNLNLGVYYLPNKGWFHSPQFSGVQYVAAFKR